jgi:hypothetical protein
VLPLLRIELYKVIRNKVFITVLILLTAYCSFAAFYSVYEKSSLLNLSIATVGRDENGLLKSDVGLYSSTLYNNWIGGIGGYSFLPNLFYLLLPLICVIPYGASYFSDKKSGYQRLLVLKKGKIAYAISKYIATFFSGFTLIIVPLLINLIITACLVPAYIPDPFEVLYYAVTYNQAFSDLFYTHPLLYVSIYIILSAIFAGLWSTVPTALSFFAKNKYIILLLPYVFLLFAMNICDLLFYFRVYIEASPLYFLRAASGRNPNNGYVILIEMMIIFAFTFTVTMCRGAKEDVY